MQFDDLAGKGRTHMPLMLVFGDHFPHQIKHFSFVERSTSSFLPITIPSSGNTDDTPAEWKCKKSGLKAYPASVYEI